MDDEVAAVLLALLAAVVYGAGDFLGGLASRRLPSLRVVVISQTVGLLTLLALLPLLPDAHATREDFAWAAAAGVAGGLGVAGLYRGLAEGTMSVVAPITGVVATAIPVVVGLVSGERPGPLALGAVVLAMAAVVLVSSEQGPEGERVRPSRRALVLAVGAGAAFGAFFALLEPVSDEADLVPLVAARVASISVLGTLLVVARRRPGWRRVPSVARDRAQVAGSGVFDMAANALYLLATNLGLLTVVAVVTAMYPAATVILAMLVLGERLARHQVVGVVLAAVAIAVLATA